MINLRRFCCVCLIKRNKLEKISVQENSLSYHAKLSTLIPQMRIDEIKEAIYICGECKTCIDNMFNFRGMCLRNNITLWTYIKKLRLDKNNELVDSDKSAGRRIHEFIDTNNSDIVEENDIKPGREPVDFVLPVNKLNNDDFVSNTSNVIIKDEIEIIDDYRLENDSDDRSRNVCGDPETASATGINVNKYYVRNKKPFTKPTEKKHTTKKTYKCETCNKTFGKTSHLNQHIRIHTGERPFKCGICSKSYADRSSLRSHNRVHTKEKPFKCKVCNKSFTENSNLTVHGRIHTGERPYKCDMCNKKFSRSTHLKQHIKLHIGETSQFFRYEMIYSNN